MIPWIVNILRSSEKTVLKITNGFLKITYKIEKFFLKSYEVEVEEVIEEPINPEPYDRTVTPYEQKPRIGFLDKDGKADA